MAEIASRRSGTSRSLESAKPRLRKAALLTPAPAIAAAAPEEDRAGHLTSSDIPSHTSAPASRARNARSHHKPSASGSGSSSQSSSSSRSRALRCAIYTRKSSEEGLEQDFNSLQAQREACEAYIASQRHEGWQMVADPYDDGGYSGGTLERPGLRSLLSDIAAGKIDVVVVYKVDRLTRALADFAKIVEIFDAKGASFVSVTQSFNTTSSMGRLTLNVLLSFAQFEREVTAERIRDKIAASKKKGIFMGGPLPLGYRVENRKLIIDPSEAETVRRIFATYLLTRSTIAAARELTRAGIRTRLRQRSDGLSIGGIPFTYGPLQTLLRNRVYIGEICHKGQHYPGEHAPLLDRATFDAAQQLLTDQRSSPQRMTHAMSSLLTGKIFDARGNRMAPSHTNKKGVRYRYYVSRALLDGEPERAGKPSRIQASEIEVLVTEALAKERQKRWAQGDGHEDALEDQSPVSTPLDPAHAQSIVDTMLDQVEVYASKIILTVRAPAQSQNDDGHDPTCDPGHHFDGEGAPSKDGATVTYDHQNRDDKIIDEGAYVTQRISIPCRLGYTPPSKKLIQADENTQGPVVPALPNSQRRNRDRLVIAIHKSRGWLNELLGGKVSDLTEIASREGKSVRNISMMINLAFLAPDIIEAIVKEEAPASLSASHLSQTLPLDWDTQRKLIARSSLSVAPDQTRRPTSFNLTAKTESGTKQSAGLPAV